MHLVFSAVANTTLKDPGDVKRVITEHLSSQKKYHISEFQFLLKLQENWWNTTSIEALIRNIVISV